MAPKLQRFVSPGKGNGLRAVAPICGGELLFHTEPLASCVSGKVSREVCHHCFSRCHNLLRCSLCKMARYCSSTCQRAAWSDHKLECKCLCSLFPKTPTDSVRLAAKIVFTLLKGSEDSRKHLYTLEEHESHLSSMSEQKKIGLSELTSMLHIYLQQEVADLSALPPSCQQLLNLIAKVTCNCFTISDGELQEIGVGLYPSLSLLNHDCRPNCVLVFEGQNLQLRAVRDISPEEELTISYIETLLLTEDRQKQLEDQYHFTCHCQLCESKDRDRVLLSGEEVTWHLLKEAIPKLEALRAAADWRSLSECCTHLLSVAAEVPEENLYKLQITDAATDAFIQLEQWADAAGYGEKTLPAYRQYFPDPHPVHGVQLIRIGKLQHHLGNIKEAFETFRQAFEILKITHGEDHSLTSDLRMKMQECCCEMDQRLCSYC